MDSRDLTTKQADELYQRLRPMFSYLVDLQTRMEQRQFDADDRLYLEVKAARYAMQLLCKDVHRIVCGPSYGGDRRAE